jgi:hypothetical protein
MYGGDSAIDKPTSIYVPYDIDHFTDMQFGQQLDVLIDNEFYLRDIHCEMYPYDQNNVYIEPFFPNIDELAKIPKDFFVMTDNLAEDTGDGYTFKFENALFIRGGY